MFAVSCLDVMVPWSRFSAGGHAADALSGEGLDNEVDAVQVTRGVNPLRSSHPMKSFVYAGLIVALIAVAGALAGIPCTVSQLQSDDRGRLVWP